MLSGYPFLSITHYQRITLLGKINDTRDAMRSNNYSIPTARILWEYNMNSLFKILNLVLKLIGWI